MKLWILNPTAEGQKRITYDCYNAFIVRAKTENSARNYAASRKGYESRAMPKGSSFWKDPALSTCTELTNEGDAGIVIASYLAG
jgi:hypothetical protein